MCRRSSSVRAGSTRGVLLRGAARTRETIVWSRLHVARTSNTRRTRRQDAAHAGISRRLRLRPPESPPAMLFPQVDTLHARLRDLQKTVGREPAGRSESVEAGGGLRGRPCSRVQGVPPKVEAFGHCKEYVKEFSYLMLDIRDMFEEDKLFNFLSGLQAWAQTELRRQGVKDLSSAIAATNQLVDFRVTSGSEPEKEEEDYGRIKGNLARTKKGCYLCKDDHRMQDCPKCGKLNTLVAEADGEVVMAMLDTGATHKFVADREIQKLGLTLAQHSSRIKAVNSEAKLIQGVVCVDLKGTYLQDFIRSAEKKDTLMSALQVKTGLQHGEQTYPTALIEMKPYVVQEVQDEVTEVLKEYKDVFPPEFPKRLPLHRAINHAIELEPGARPPAQAPYCMCPAELRSSWMAVGGRIDPAVQGTVWFPYFVSRENKMAR
ncbi:UNVERIFIED_CONTAM: hypothetical protein Scaly_1156800 [Sesamum calycinum]|uniref:Uncharacterized protein n=1 Tax=Sesamum calycinum TaxID=2727403 RepID=A0AAW2Q2R2_9LAMI